MSPGEMYTSGRKNKHKQMERWLGQDEGGEHLFTLEMKQKLRKQEDK